MDFVSKVVVEYHEGKVREEEEEGFLGTGSVERRDWRGLMTSFQIQDIPATAHHLHRYLHNWE
jgi:hypothetical protein